MAHANPQQHEEAEIKSRSNSRSKQELFITGQHMRLERLKELMSGNKMAEYLRKEIPLYPTPVEFWVSNVAHVTEESGFEGILESEEFRPRERESSESEPRVLWWGLKINKEEIREAEKRYMKENQKQELNEQQPFLKEFTTSPAFQLKKSRYGNYRFTFPLTDLMQWYKEQNCGGEEPVLRVYETVTYKQEIMYTVLIHSPEDNERFREYPLLEASEWVSYKDGKIIWKAQAICGTHWYHFDLGEVMKLSTHEFYVWDHVSLMFHLPNSKALKIPKERLIKALEACKIDEPDLSWYQGPKTKEINQERFRKATIKVNELKGLEEE